MYTFQTYEVDGGYGFCIMADGNVIITQDFKPDEPGFVPMTFEEAEFGANAVLERLA